MVQRDVENAVDPQRRNNECQRENNKHATFCSCNNEQRCTIYPWTKNSVFAPWTIYAWGVLLSASVVICVYTAASNRVQKGFTIHNTWWKPFQLSNSTSNNSSSTTTLSQMNDTSPPGDLLLHLATLNFSPANDLVLYVFVFRSILVIFASYFTVAWFSTVDQSTRFSQPFANMYKEKEEGATATESILLDYLWGLPGLVTYDAFSNSHYKVAWFSILDLASPIFPILVGGIFTITNTGELIVFTIVPVAFYFVLAYLAVYLVTMFFVFPGRGRRLLRFHFSIADYASLFYASHLLNDTDLEHPEKDTLDISGKNVTSRHLYSRIFLEEKKYKMGFYVGIDKQWHWGLERADLGDVEFVTWREFQQQNGRLP